MRFSLEGRSPPNRIRAKTAELLSQHKEYGREPGRNSVQKPRDGTGGVSVCASGYKVGPGGPATAGRNSAQNPRDGTGGVSVCASR